MRSDRDRSTAWGQGGNAAEPIRVRGVNADTLQNRRLKWDRVTEEYTPTEEEIEFFEPDKYIAKQLAEGAEAWVIFRQAANRYEEIAGGTGGSTLKFAQVVTTVYAGTSWATPGSGTVQPKDINGLDDGATIDVVNFRPEQFDVGYIIIFDSAQVDGSDRRLLIDGVCAGY